jgi:arsenate reductase (glutaredoxin)
VNKPITIYHNPCCGKSRATLALLQERCFEPLVIEYLKDPPSQAQLRVLSAKLGIRPEQLARKGEEVYKRKHKDKALSDEQWLAALAENPILIERPIVVRGERAVLGRPPEQVLELLSQKA